MADEKCREYKLDALPHPETVRRLRLDELFWLPVIEDAEASAVEQIQAIQDKS